MNILQSRAIHGPSAHVILIMAAQPARSWTRAELEQWCMYPDNAILGAMSILIEAGLVIAHGDSKRTRSYQYHPDNPLGLAFADGFSMFFSGQAAAHEEAESYPQPVDNFDYDGDNDPFGENNHPETGRFSTVRTTTTVTSEKETKAKKRKEVSKYQVTSNSADPSLRRSEFLDNAELELPDELPDMDDDTPANRGAWLRAGGLNITAGPVQSIIYDSSIDLRYVANHVLNFAYEVEVLHKPHTPGLLLTRFRMGDPEPPPRCPECLAHEGRCACKVIVR